MTTATDRHLQFIARFVHAVTNRPLFEDLARMRRERILVVRQDPRDRQRDAA